MKVKLAAQTLSSSVADALDFCKCSIQLPYFRDCQATVEFMRLVDALFDVLNSTNKFDRGMKAALKPENKESTISLFGSSI